MFFEDGFAEQIKCELVSAAAFMSSLDSAIFVPTTIPNFPR
jgi:hypothetical protein